MIEFSEIKEYMQIITTVVAALLGYLFAFKKLNKEKFYTQLDDNLGGILTPMYHEIKKIMREESGFQREKLLKSFFEKHTSENTNIYKISNKSILDTFYNTEELFYNFTKNRNRYNWEQFWISFDNLNNIIDGEIITIRGVIYSDYRWSIVLSQKNFMWRFVFEVSASIVEMLKFLIVICTGAIFIFIVALKRGEPIVSGDVISLLITILGTLIMIYITIYVPLSNHYSLKKKQRESFFMRDLEKGRPRLYNMINKIMSFFINSEIKIKRNVKIPKMYNN